VFNDIMNIYAYRNDRHCGGYMRTGFFVSTIQIRNISITQSQRCPGQRSGFAICPGRVGIWVRLSYEVCTLKVAIRDGHLPATVYCVLSELLYNNKILLILLVPRK